MYPFKFASALCLFIGSLVTLVSSTRFPGADTPTFYLVSSSLSNSANLLPLRQNGGTNGWSSLTGSGTIGQFFFFQGNLVAGSPGNNALIAAIPISAGDCSTSGQLGFAGSTTDKCAIRSVFSIQSDPENSQLGASLAFNNVGGFFACGAGLDVWYFPGTADSGCTAINLFTVPVLPIS